MPRSSSSRLRPWLVPLLSCASLVATAPSPVDAQSTCVITADYQGLAACTCRLASPRCQWGSRKRGWSCVAAVTPPTRRSDRCRSPASRSSITIAASSRTRPNATRSSASRRTSGPPIRYYCAPGDAVVDHPGHPHRRRRDRRCRCRDSARVHRARHPVSRYHPDIRRVDHRPTADRVPDDDGRPHRVVRDDARRHAGGVGRHHQLPACRRHVACFVGVTFRGQVDVAGGAPTFRDCEFGETVSFGRTSASFTGNVFASALYLGSSDTWLPAHRSRSWFEADAPIPTIADNSFVGSTALLYPNMTDPAPPAPIAIGPNYYGRHRRTDLLGLGVPGRARRSCLPLLRLWGPVSVAHGLQPRAILLTTGRHGGSRVVSALLAQGPRRRPEHADAAPPRHTGIDCHPAAGP